MAKLIRPAEQLADGRPPDVSSSYRRHLARTPPSNSPGVDITYRKTRGKGFEVPKGARAIASAGGTIKSVKFAPRGVVVELDLGRGVVLVYRHLRMPTVVKGDKVVAGQALGLISHDPKDSAKTRHLHFEVLVGGKRIDPEPLFQILPSGRAGEPITKQTSTSDILEAVKRGRENALAAKLEAVKRGRAGVPSRAKPPGNGAPIPWALLVIVGLLLMSSRS